jgi:hypothetical protein
MAVPPGARKKVEFPPAATVLAACSEGATKGGGTATTFDSVTVFHHRSVILTFTLVGGATRSATKKVKSWRSVGFTIKQ